MTDSSHHRILAALQLWGEPRFEYAGSYQYMKELPLDITEKDQPAPLSSTAQTVFDAAWNLPVPLGDIETTRRRQIAASLHSIADQLKLDPKNWEGFAPDEYERAWNEAMGRIAQIAAELEGTNG
jgi:hypothetical protein